MQKRSRRLRRKATALVVVDIQERLVPAICHREQLIQNTVRLIKGATALGLPLLSTEQYRKGLGPTVPEVAHAIIGFSPLQKLSFSASGASGFFDVLADKKISQALLCGIETHVCVLQSALDLLDQGVQVFVAADAVSSRTQQNHQLGLERMAEAGAVVVSTEMALFELVETAAAREFKEILALVK